MKNNPQSLTTGEVAKLCNVSGAMVRRWVDKVTPLMGNEGRAREMMRVAGNLED